MKIDDLQAIEKIDRSQMRKLLLEFPLQCEKAIQIGDNLNIPQNYLQKRGGIVICGMGGSAIGGEVLKTLLSEKMKVPIFVNRDYNLPQYIDEKILAFIVSYSGNTEEALSAYEEAKKRGSLIIFISSGGKLKKLSREDKIFLITIPPGMPPRTALGYLFIPLLKTLERLGLVEKKDYNYNELLKILSVIRDRYSPQVPLKKNFAKSTACELLGKIPLIYGVERKTDVVACRLKTQFNENSKVAAFWNVFPELNHNEIVGWTGVGKVDLKEFYPIFIRDDEEKERIKKRIEITQSIMKEKGIRWTEIWSEGKNPLTKIFSSIYIGDWISFYLAILQEIDPTPIKMIDLFKKQLNELR
ncbi:MAG: bifunctional phosphoglucose/phosphomannose isomerase [Candidatus Aerophobetes bacterium]|nr:bifunctional phosphoglucose/phosphomannose isomerase [Candidatus Aerophobetes bacterium]